MAEKGWISFAENTWHIFAEKRWISFAENKWYTNGRKLTLATDLLHYFSEHRIYLPEKVSNKIDELYDQFVMTDYYYRVTDAQIEIGADSAVYPGYSLEWENALHSLNERIPSIMKNLENAFCVMLGDTDETREKT